MEIRILSRKAMEKMLLTESFEKTAIISFSDPRSKIRNDDYAPINFNGKCHEVFKIEEYDLDISALKDFGLSFDSYFKDAENLAKFVYRVRSNGFDIICQCEFGQSRSAGCAAAILEHFSHTGIRIFANYKYYPNQLIFNKLLDALNKTKATLEQN